MTYEYYPGESKDFNFMSLFNGINSESEVLKTEDGRKI